MRLLKKITNVTFPISLLTNEYFIIGINSEFKLFDGFNIIDFDNKRIPETGFKKILKKVYFYLEKKIYQIDLETLKSDIFIEYTSDELWLLNSRYFFYANKTKERREYKFDFFSNERKSILWSAIDKLELTNLSNDFLIFTNLNRTVYSRYDFNSGKKLWSLDFSENRVIGTVHLIENILIFPTTNKDVIGIAIESGKELWRIQNVHSGYFQTQPETNYLVSFNSNSMGDNWYCVINPLTGEKVVDKKFDKFHYGTGSTQACIDGDYYYFISDLMGFPEEMRTERITHLGCINLQSHEIKWIEEVGKTADRRSGYQKPEVHNGKVYLLDGEQTLHIYELG